MQIDIKKESGLNVLALSGEVDLHESPEARKRILACIESNTDLLVDLSGITYIDSSGIASLIEGLQLAKSMQLNFGLVGVSNAAMQVLRLSRLDQVFTIYNSVDDYRAAR